MILVQEFPISLNMVAEMFLQAWICSNLQEKTHAELWFQQTYLNRTLAWVSFGKFATYFRIPFDKNTHKGLLLAFQM